MLSYLAHIDMVGWGEPLIHPEFGQVLDKLKTRTDRRARISLTTNGLHLEKWVDRLIEANVRHFAISIHAASPGTHEDLMGLPRGSFEKVLEGVRKLVAARGHVPKLLVSFVFIVTRQNLAEIPEFVQLAETLGVDTVFIRTLKARTAEEQKNDGLDYHRLPPYLHPQFESLRARAAEAIAAATIQIEAFPESWSTPVFPPELEPQILMAPLTPREVRMRSKSLRRGHAVDSEDLPVGEPLEDSRPELHEHMENPYNRMSPMWCPSPYTAFYINGFDRHVNPCCYMTSIPGHQKTYLRKNATFDDVWNSPAMVALRRSLNEGPLKQPCLKCAFYW
jgi:MoaA/NifB/PqqE/SkfB family radical SAM enzyme